MLEVFRTHFWDRTFLFHGANHWLCLSTAGCKEGELDSLYNTVPPKAKRQIAVLMRSPVKKLKKIISSMSLSKREPPTVGCMSSQMQLPCALAWTSLSLKYKQKSMHQHLLQCLEAGFITPFPRVLRCTCARSSGEEAGS